MEKLEQVYLEQNKDKYGLSKTFLQGLSEGNLAVYRYETDEERDSLLERSYLFHYDNKQVVAIRVEK